MRREREFIAVPKIAVVAIPGKDLADILRGKIAQKAAIDQFAEDQAVGVEDAGEHISFLGRVAPAHVSKAVQDLTDTPQDRLNALLLGLGLADEHLLESGSLLIESLDADQVIAML